MPWISKELYKTIPKAETLKQMSLKKLVKICIENHILIEHCDAKVDIIKSILLHEKEMESIRIL